MRIGILTGGGDVPGLNPAIKAFVKGVGEAGHSVVGLRRGWGAFVKIDPYDAASVANHTLELDWLAVRTIDRTGGTILHSSRTNPGRVSGQAFPAFLARPESEPPYDLTDHAVRVVEALGLDALVAIGGDDTLSYALRMHEEGVPVVAIPKTMDNDVPGTEYCIGFSTAVTRSVGFVTNLRTAVGSHERVAVVELFGRYSGATALLTGYLASADRTLIAEVPFDIERLVDMVMADRSANPSRYAVVVVSEGASLLGGDRVESGEADAYGHRKLGGIGEITGDFIKRMTGVGIMNQKVAYLMRSGPPDIVDLMVGFNYGTMAAELLLSEVSGRMVALQGGVYTTEHLSVLAQGARTVDVDSFYDVENYRPDVRALDGKPMFLY
ncbi:MAG: 6-phosphofructokinase [bacterium]|nr:6-phosphofructokinase [bacterium]